MTYPFANVQNSESPFIFILNPLSPLAATMRVPTYPGTNAAYPLLTYYRSDFLVDFLRLVSLMPLGVEYNSSIGFRSDWEYNIDIDLMATWAADPRHHIKTVIISTGPHYNELQFGGGIPLPAIQEVYRSAMEYIVERLDRTIREDQIAFYRASTSGHSNGRKLCSTKEPLRETSRLKYFNFNWHGQEVYNAIWKTYLTEGHLAGKWKNIRYLDVSRPSMLRPDAVPLAISRRLD
jgi:hypothetical protein